MMALEGIVGVKVKRKSGRPRARLAFAPAGRLSVAPRLLVGKASKMLVWARGCRTIGAPCAGRQAIRQTNIDRQGLLDELEQTVLSSWSDEFSGWLESIIWKSCRSGWPLANIAWQWLRRQERVI